MPAEQNILDSAVKALKRTTGLDGRIRNARAGRGGVAPDIFELAVARRKHRFQTEVKPVDRFATPAIIKATSKAGRKPPLLVAPYISREVAERCRLLRLPFIDAAGNAYLEGPGLFVYVVGNPKPMELRRDRFRALTPAGLQIVFALACMPTLVQTNYREIAARARVALGTVGPVMKDLEARGYLRFRNGPNRKLLDPERMLEEWITHYPVTLRPKLNSRRFRAETENLRHAGLLQNHAYWGGEAAAEKLTGYLKPAQFTIYAREPVSRLVAAGRMRADPVGNVEILDSFWNFDPDRDFPDVVPPLLAYADLLASHDGRNAEAARMIYEQRIAPALHAAN